MIQTNKTETRRKPVSVPRCQPQIPRGIERTWAYGVTATNTYMFPTAAWREAATL